MSVYIRKFRTRGVYTNKQAFRQEVLKSMNRDIDPRILGELSEIVENWETIVTFKVSHDISSTGILSTVTPSGPGAMTFTVVSRGTRGHWINVRNRSSRRGKGNPAMLLYRYSPKTSPSPHLARGFGGPGTYVGGGAFRKRVYHPGAKPRHFERYVIQAVRKDFYRFIENALRRAVRRAQREGT